MRTIVIDDATDSCIYEVKINRGICNDEDAIMAMYVAWQELNLIKSILIR